MNLLEHYIQEVLSVEDVTEEYEKIVGRKLKYPTVKVEMLVDCYGKTEQKTEYFLKPAWEKTLKLGYYLA